VTTVDYAIDGTTLTLPDNAVITVCEWWKSTLLFDMI
jgi:hypothetical protein